jgi:hypothetical protein
VTPGAATTAARAARDRAARSATHARSTHPRPVRARPAPTVPRRVSGPVRTQSPRVRPHTALARAAGFVRGLPDHPLLDRLVRGRAWIPVLGVMLTGIVAMQVEVLKLNASEGRSIALTSSLQARNELLRTSVSSLSDAQRIERLAARMGMVMPGPTAVDFLHGRASAGRVVGAIHPPDAALFDSALQASTAQANATSGAPTVTPATNSSGAGGAASAAPATGAPTAAAPAGLATTPTTAATASPGSTATGSPGTGTGGTGGTGSTGAGATPTGTAPATGTTAPAAGATTTPAATAGATNPGGAAPAG